MKIRPFSLWFGVLAVPLAWSAYQLFSYYLASRRCGANAAHNQGMLDYAVSLPFIVATIVALGIACTGMWVALMNWRKVRSHLQGLQQNSELDPNGIGFERSHFLAKCGMINSVLFLTAFVFTVSAMLVAPLCAQ